MTDATMSSTDRASALAAAILPTSAAISPTRPDGAPVLELAGVTLRLGIGEAAVTTLDGVDLIVRAGEFLAVVGPSGSGKSSLLAVAGALTTPGSGTVRIAGTDLGPLGPRALTRLRRDHIGYVFQSANLMPSLTAREQLLLPMHLAKRLDSGARDRANELLETVGMTARADRRPDQLSGGERQRIGLARALMPRPELLLVDEPTSALDRERAGEIVALLARQSRSSATATVMVTHDTHVLGLADRARRLVDGRLLDLDPHRDLSPLP
jgi:putative ABC transport system ATP-binding protein